MTSEFTPEAVRAALDAATPGPWVQGGKLAHTSAYDFYDPFDPRGVGIACVSGEPEGEANPVDIANARLIAMAPDLAAAYLAMAEENERLRAELIACRGTFTLSEKEQSHE